MNKEEQEAIEDLKLEIKQDEEELPYSKECLKYEKIILNLIYNQEKVIDKMAKMIWKHTNYENIEDVKKKYFKEIEDENE